MAISNLKNEVTCERSQFKVKIRFFLVGHWCEWLDSPLTVRYTTLLWVLPTPQTILAVGLDWELSPLVRNCDSLRFVLSKFQNGDWDAKVTGGPSEDPHSFKSITSTFPIVFRVSEQLVQSHHHLYSLWRLFSTSSLAIHHSKRCPIKNSDP